MQGEPPIRLLYVISQDVRWVMFEWIAARLDRERFQLCFLVLYQRRAEIAERLAAQGFDCETIRYSGFFRFPTAVVKIAALCRRKRIDLVHVHFVKAALAGLTGAALAGVRGRLQTRHHAGPLPRDHRPSYGVLFDRYCNRLSTQILAPSRQAWRALAECDHVAEAKIRLLPHGFDWGAFRDVSEIEVEELRKKYGIADDGPVVGVIARYEKIKGVRHIVQAFARLLRDHPSALLVLANAQGRDSPAVRGELKRLPAERYVEIGFEPNPFALYRLFDLFVHVPVGPAMEGFGQVYVEALAAGLPSVFTRSGVACEFLVHLRDAWIVEPGRSDQIFTALKSLIADPGLRAKLSRNGATAVRERFGVDSMVAGLERAYLEEWETIRERSGDDKSQLVESGFANSAAGRDGRR